MEKTNERRAEARRRKELSRERLKLIRYLLAALAILLAINIFFEISDIQVEGNVIYSSSEIREASGLRTGINGLLPVGPFVSRRIRGTLPGIASARVSLSVPDRLVITVRETAAVAVLTTESGPVLLSEECKVVSGFRGDEKELIRVRGLQPQKAETGKTLRVPETESAKLNYLRELLPLLEQKGIRADVQDLDLSNVSDLRFSYLERFTVRLGRQEALSGKLDLMQRIVANLGAGDAGILDMSTPQEGHYFPG
jgi:Cell division septal protein